MVRGASFLPAEDAALARCWVSTSGMHDEQNGPDFRDNVAEAYNMQPEAAERSRVPGSQHSRWQTLNKIIQKYLAAERLSRSQPVSGETEEEVLQNIMVLFRRRTRYKDRNGVWRDGPILKSMGAVQVLRSSPKSTAPGGTPETCPLDSPPPFEASPSPYPASSPETGATIDPTSSTPETEAAAAVPSVCPSTRRHVGVKKSKKIDKRGEGNSALAAIANALEEGSRRKSESKKMQLRFNCFNSLPDGADKTRILMEMLNSQDLSISQNQRASRECSEESSGAGGQSLVGVDRLIGAE